MSAATTESNPYRLIEEEVSYKRPDVTGEVASLWRRTIVRPERNGSWYKLMVYVQAWVTNAGENTAIPLAAVEDSLTGFLTRGESLPTEYRIMLVVDRSLYLNSVQVSRETVHDGHVSKARTLPEIKNDMVAHASLYGGEVEDVLREKYPEYNIVVL